MKKRKKKTKLELVIEYIKTFFINYKHVFTMILSFIILDFSLRYATRSINFYNIFKLVPNLFTLLWTTLFIGISLSFNKKTSKIIYLISIILSLILFLVQSIYYSCFSNFFDFTQLENAGEASEYLVNVILHSPLWIWIIFVIDILLIIISLKWIPKKKKFNPILLSIIIIIFIIGKIFTPTMLGKTYTTWDAWRKPRNIYNSFNDNKRSMQIAGFYEYNIRNFYVSFIRKKDNNTSEIDELLEEKFNDNTEYKNNYTGLFKDKNVIFIQMEGIDKFLVTKDIMPTLYSMQNNSINFTNHYSFVNGGGSTFNSEYMVNTGYTSPITVNNSAYTYSKNNYSYSLPNLLKKEGYTVNAFHMNTAEYYSRDVNYKSWGYDSFNSLKSLDTYTDNSYWLDTELINNPIFNEKIFNTEEKFANFIITYSAHTPFQSNKGVCSLLVPEGTTKEYSEFDCLKLQAKETDNMLKLLLKNLKDKKLIDNTILVIYTDHYLYTLEDQELLSKYKHTENNLINNTTFMIWSNKQKKKNINDVTSQLNILPTVANILGLEYHPNYYLMKDALDKNYEGLVFFNDHSWYDGNVYVDNGIVTNNKKISKEKLDEKNILVNNLININDGVITKDYFKNIKK